MDILLLLISLAVKSTIILLAAFAVTGLVKRLSSSERHLIWCLAFLCLVLLPVMTFIVPKYRFTVPMAGYSALFNIDTIMFDQQQTIPVVAPVQKSPYPLDTLFTMIKKLGTGTAISMVYWLVLSVLLPYLCFIYWRISRSSRELTRVNNPDVIQRVQDIRQLLGIGRNVEVLQSEHDQTPWTWGIFRPRVILPANFTTWPVEEQQNALIHELSHIRRFDLISFLLVRLCCCLYWFHPLAWLGYRKMVMEAEKACDDRVLLNGSKASLYARQLMDIANTIYRGHRQQPLVAAMARCSSLTYRIRSILNTDLNRNLIRNNVLTLTIVTAFALSISLVSFETIAEIPNQKSAATGDAITTKMERYNADAAGAEADPVKGPVVPAMREVIYKKLSKAQELVEAGNYNDGLAVLNDLDAMADLNPYERAQVENFFGFTYFSMKRFDNAVQAYKRELMQQDLPKALILNATYTLAQLYIMLENYEEAIERMNQWLAMTNSPTIESYMILGQAYYNLGQYRNAVIPLQKAYDLWNGPGKKPKPGMLQLIRAAYMKLGDEENVKRITGELKRLYPDIAENPAPDKEIGKSGSLGLTPADGDYLPIVKVMPVYPKRALARKLEGYVVVEFTITTEGMTKDIKVVEAKPIAIFNQSAIQAAEKFKFKPRVVDGQPVEVQGVRNLIKFALDNKKESESD